MKKYTLLIILIYFASSYSFSYGNSDKYHFKVNLAQVKNDKLYIELSTPKIKSSEITYYMPKIIPGTYKIADYGRYVSELKALDKKGRELTVERLDDNSWKIIKANKLVKITYWVEDSYDSELEGPDIFQPAGTNFEEGKNFILNTPGIFGYFEDMKQLPFKLDITYPDNFYGGTGLIALPAEKLSAKLSNENKIKDNSTTTDQYLVENYDRLVDSPIMYAEVDTALIKVANTEVLVSSYSPNKMINAKEIAETLTEVLTAQSKYLGGKLPVEKYAFIFYFTDKPVTYFGALEHSYSSMYYMPESNIERTRQQLRDFAAHEFFHIVTPLNIHSKEIHAFDFNEPKMSKHLWMYEGITEYFAGNMQVKYGIIDPAQYMQVIQQKIIQASNYNDSVAFTDISKHTLDKYPDQYGNVYQKGALIGMCLDILLRELSEGKYGVQDMMSDLAKKYGKDQAFSDDSLFEEIEKMTYPEVREFLDTYVGGNSPLPYQEMLQKVGLKYIAEEKIMSVSLGITNETIGADPEARTLYIRNAEILNEFGKLLGFQNGDVIKKINGNEFPLLGPETGPFIGARRQELIVGNTFSYTVLRNGEEVKLETPVKEIEQTVLHQIVPEENISDEQLALRKAWLRPAN